jgi:hypothetical protein
MTGGGREELARHRGHITASGRPSVKKKRRWPEASFAVRDS